MSDIARQVKEFILANFLFGDAERLPADTESLVESGIVDSTGMLEVIEFLESNFGIEVSDKDTVPENLDSVANIAAFVQNKQSAS